MAARTMLRGFASAFTGRAAAARGAARGRRAFHATTPVTMGLRTGIVGLPNVGKSTLFNAMVENGKAEAANYPFCTIEPNVGLVTVPDERLSVLEKINSSAKVIPTSIEFVDIAGLVAGASKGEGLGNKFLSHIREVDLIVQMVRCFEDDNVVHVSGRVDPVSDIDTIGYELALRDIDQVETRLERLKKPSREKGAQEKNEAEAAALGKLLPLLEEGKPARTAGLDEEEAELVAPLCLLTMKPVVFAANVSEDELGSGGEGNAHVAAVRARAEAEGAPVVVVSAAVEAELSDLAPEERAEYLESLGATEGGLKSLVTAAYSRLGLRTYFTSGETETRAWTIREGMTAPQAAGVIHTDFERGFIAAETVAYDDLAQAGSMLKVKEAGKLRSEGKTYVVDEGDVMLFRFNV